MMDTYFKILLSCDSYKKRPQISYKIREYLAKFITENLLKEKKLVVGGKWKINLGLIFLTEGKYGPKYIKMANSPRTIRSDGIKLYEIVIPLKLIEESDKQLLKTIELIYESLKIFFTTTFKKITPEFMDELWKKIDLDYLLCLPYPAPLEEQKYVGDVELPGGAIIVQHD